jgi:putative oxidoreductase
MTPEVSLGLLLLRLAFGLTVAAHGAQKMFGLFEGPGLDGFTGMLGKLGIRPERPFAVAAAAGELGGGLLVALGFLMPVGPLVVAGGMVVAIATVHLARGFWNQAGGYEFPFLVLCAMLGLSFTGPGAVSLDYLVGLQLPEPATWIVVAIVSGLGAGAALASRATRREVA